MLDVVSTLKKNDSLVSIPSLSTTILALHTHTHTFSAHDTATCSTATLSVSVSVAPSTSIRRRVSKIPLNKVSAAIGCAIPKWAIQFKSPGPLGKPCSCPKIRPKISSWWRVRIILLQQYCLSSSLSHTHILHSRHGHCPLSCLFAPFVHGKHGRPSHVHRSGLAHSRCPRHGRIVVQGRIGCHAGQCSIIIIIIGCHVRDQSGNAECAGWQTLCATCTGGTSRRFVPAVGQWSGHLLLRCVCLFVCPFVLLVRLYVG